MTEVIYPMLRDARLVGVGEGVLPEDALMYTLCTDHALTFLVHRLGWLPLALFTAGVILATGAWMMHCVRLKDPGNVIGLAAVSTLAARCSLYDLSGFTNY